MKTALLFPGQGAQFVGMGAELFQTDPEAEAFLTKADKVLHLPLSTMILEGPEEALKRTPITQPAILTVSTAFADRLNRSGFVPDLVAGHSLGEYSALVHTGSLTFEDAVRTVHFRGRYMQEAVPEGEGAMAAVMGLSTEQVERICAEAEEAGHVCAANLNAPGQTVISGSAAGVQRAVELAKDAGAKRAIPLKVSAPFHSLLMEPARVRMEAILNNVEFRDLQFPLVTNVDAVPIQKGEAARDSLIRQITAPVRWVESVEKMIELGVRRFVEVSPGSVLSGLVRRISGDVEVISLSGLEEIRTFAGGQA